MTARVVVCLVLAGALAAPAAYTEGATWQALGPEQKVAVVWGVYVGMQLAQRVDPDTWSDVVQSLDEIGPTTLIALIDAFYRVPNMLDMPLWAAVVGAIKLWENLQNPEPAAPPEPQARGA
jgi:hypothetical protein